MRKAFYLKLNTVQVELFLYRLLFVIVNVLITLYIIGIRRYIP